MYAAVSKELTNMHIRDTRAHVLLALLIFISLSFMMACGGGGSSSPIVITPPPTNTTAHPHGVWTTLPYLMTTNPVHAFLIHEPISSDQAEGVGPVGKVFLVTGSGDDENQHIYHSAILNLSAATITIGTMDYDSFCAGLTILPNGNPFLAGGSRYDPINSPGQELGISNTSEYDVDTNMFTDQQPMAHGRWYDTLTLLGDGRVMADSGYDQVAMNATTEIFTPGVGWSPEFPMMWNDGDGVTVPPFYPRQHVLPNGKVFFSGQDTDTRIFDPAVASTTNSGWTHVAFTNYGGTAKNEVDRSYGSSVLLPLTPQNGYDPRVMILGGDITNSTDTTEIIDLGLSAPTWQWGPKMSQRRVRMNAVLLPDGKVLAMGGSVIDEEWVNYQQAIASASLNADLYDPATNTFSPAGVTAYAHLDHSVALLLPDATVWLAGNQVPPDLGQTISFEQHMEIYQPAYLFNADGSFATRPVIAGVQGAGTTSDSTPIVNYGTQFTTLLQAPADIASVVLIRPGATTHSFNSDQRLVGLVFQTADNGLLVTVPSNHNILPPGYYMLFLVSKAGVPSMAQFVDLQ